MNRQNFNIPGGYPVETDTLQEMEKACSLLNALGQIAGDKAILKGCVDDGENVGKGVVYVGGELFEFRGGPKQTTVVIRRDVVRKVFEDGRAHEVLCKRWMAFGSGPDALNWSEFKRYRLIEEVAELKADLQSQFTDVNAELSDLGPKLAGKAPRVHDHDDRYYTQDQTDTFFEGESEEKKQVHWDRVTEKPTTYPPASHNHDDRYYQRGQIGLRTYAYLTGKTYATVGRGRGLSSSIDYYGSNQVCCSVTAELESTGEQDIQVLTLGFSKVKLT